MTKSTVTTEEGDLTAASQRLRNRAVSSEPAETPAAACPVCGGAVDRVGQFRLWAVYCNSRCRNRARTRRSRRHRARAHTVSVRELPTVVRRHLALLPAPEDTRPRTRGDCLDGPRPCPWASCRHHLYLDVGDEGAIKINFPDLELDEIPETCALDVADHGGEPFARVGELLNLTRERVRQLQVAALELLRKRSKGVLW